MAAARCCALCYCNVVACVCVHDALSASKALPWERHTAICVLKTVRCARRPIAVSPVYESSTVEWQRCLLKRSSALASTRSPEAIKGTAGAAHSSYRVWFSTSEFQHAAVPAKWSDRYPYIHTHTAPECTHTLQNAIEWRKRKTIIYICESVFESDDRRAENFVFDSKDLCVIRLKR